MKKRYSLYSAFFVFIIFQSCGISGGFGSYEKPSRRSCKYYTKHFKVTNLHLAIGKPYRSLVEQDSLHNEFYFVFYSNGFVLHNSGASLREVDNVQSQLDYTKIYGEDVGSYLTKGDTVFWGTKAGYMKNYNYYAALITPTGLRIISSPQNVKTNFLALQD